MPIDPHAVLKAYGAIYNQSMLRDAALSEVEQLQKKFRVRYTDSMKVFASLGHVYSVMVEELDIQTPDIAQFMQEMNERVKRGGVPEARFHNIRDVFYSKSLRALSNYLYEKAAFGEIKNDSAYRIYLSAVGGSSEGLFSESLRDGLDRLKSNKPRTSAIPSLSPNPSHG